MEEPEPKKSFNDQIKANLPKIAVGSASAVVGGAAVALYFTKYRTTVTWCHIKMSEIDTLKEQGQGVIGFGMDSRNKILVALPDKV